MSKKSLIELIKIIEKEISSHENFIQLYAGDTNPQIVQMVNETNGKIIALESVLHYAKTGSKSYFEAE